MPRNALFQQERINAADALVCFFPFGGGLFQVF